MTSHVFYRFNLGADITDMRDDVIWNRRLLQSDGTESGNVDNNLPGLQQPITSFFISKRASFIHDSNGMTKEYRICFSSVIPYPFTT